MKVNVLGNVNRPRPGRPSTEFAAGEVVGGTHVSDDTVLSVLVLPHTVPGDPHELTSPPMTPLSV